MSPNDNEPKTEQRQTQQLETQQLERQQLERQQLETQQLETQQRGKCDYRAQLERITEVGSAHLRAADQRNYGLAEAILTLLPDAVDRKPFYAGLALVMQQHGEKDKALEASPGYKTVFESLRAYYVQRAGECLGQAKKTDQ